MKIISATNNRKRQAGVGKIERYFRSGIRPQRVIPVTRENHQSNLLPSGYDLVIRLKFKTERVKFTGYKRFTFADGVMILRISPAAGNNIIGDGCIRAAVPG